MRYKKINIVLLLSIIVIVIFTLSTVFSMYSLTKLVSENNREKSLNYANEISDKVDSIFAKPKSVAQSIDNPIVCEILSNLEEHSEEQLSSFFQEYLLDVVNRNNYDTAFIVPKETLRCYTEHGYSYYVDLSSDDNIWFNTFLNSGLEYELNVDNDQANGNRTVVYVNIRMDDEFGNAIGSCGVGVSMEDIFSQLNEIEILPGFKIEFVSRNGKIQLSSDPEFQKSFFEHNTAHLDKYVSSDQLKELINYRETYNDSHIKIKYVQKDKKSSYIIKFIDQFEWYLVVSHTAPRISKSSYILLQNFIVFLIALILLLFISNLGMNKYHFKVNEFKTKTEIDSLTGILNRYAFEERRRVLSQYRTLEDISVAVVDINSLKRVNDTHGHNAGDELIRSTARILKKFFSQNGKVYRTGGDEFIVIMENPGNVKIQSLENDIKELKSMAYRYNTPMVRSINISIGFASGKTYDSLNIDRLIQIADRNMYEDKKLYYQTFEKDRRER